MADYNGFEVFQIFTIKVGTFFAGLFGATIALLKRGEGSILARLGGYLSAIFAIIYFVPGVVELVKYVFSYQMPDVAEHILAFSFGMVANSMVESFLDDPTGSLRRWISNAKAFRKSIFNSPIESSVTIDKNINEEKVSEVEKDGNS